MPGMVKRRCIACGFWYAADPAVTERRCPDCIPGATPPVGRADRVI